MTDPDKTAEAFGLDPDKRRGIGAVPLVWEQLNGQHVTYSDAHERHVGSAPVTFDENGRMVIGDVVADREQHEDGYGVAGAGTVVIVPELFIAAEQLKRQKDLEEHGE